MTFSIGDSARKLFKFDTDFRRPGAVCDFALHWDKEMAYGQILPRPSLADIPSFYQTEGYKPHDGVAVVEAVSQDSIFQKILNKVSWISDRSIETNAQWWEQLLGGSPVDVLEIGCGRGGKLARIKNLGHHVIGVEPDERAIALANASGIEVYQGTAENLPTEVAEKRFDCVMLMHVLEHCSDPLLSLQNASEMLKPDGYLVVETPNNDCISKNFFGKTWTSLDVPRHLNFFTLKSLRSIASEANLDVMRHEFRGYCRMFNSDQRRHQSSVREAMSEPSMNSLFWYFWLFMRTFLAPPTKKYDSVRIVAKP